MPVILGVLTFGDADRTSRTRGVWMEISEAVGELASSDRRCGEPVREELFADLPKPLLRALVERMLRGFAFARVLEVEGRLRRAFVREREVERGLCALGRREDEKADDLANEERQLAREVRRDGARVERVDD